MSRFIELHQPDSSAPRPIIVNLDWIEYVVPLKEGALLYFGTINVDGQQDRVGSRPYSIQVTEDYYTVKELLQCQ
ncbi:MAG: hypothetical protein IKM85_08535 [Bacteroidales bacterium]|nr:hypothetical protein [Bacteroidales bacterium]